jgi:hypothetical protein
MRVRTLVVFGIGYLMGTRAGQDRYQQIIGSVRELAESDAVRGYADRAFGVARRAAGNVGADVTADDTGVDETTKAGGGRTKARRES